MFALIRFPPTLHGLRNQADAIAAHDAYRRLGKIRVPTLMMTGEEDTLIDPRNAPIMAELIPGAELRLFPDLKHAFHLERPDAINDEIIDFIERAHPSLAAAAGSGRIARQPT